MSQVVLPSTAESAALGDANTGADWRWLAGSAAILLGSLALVVNPSMPLGSGITLRKRLRS